MDRRVAATRRTGYPAWPSPSFPTLVDAIAEAMVNLGPGDRVIVHVEGCAEQFSLPCDCTPEVIIVPDEVPS